MGVFLGRYGFVAAAIAVGLGVLTAPAAAQEAPTVPEPPYFGFNDAWALHSDKLGFVQGTGADANRSVISWSVVEPEQGQFDWSSYDLLVERFRAVGTRPLWVLADAPCWAWTKSKRACRKKGDQPRAPKPSHYDEWAEFARQIALRYPDSVAIESWNEANLGDFFRPRPDAAKAADLTDWANQGVDSANAAMGTSIPVVFGGSAPLTETIPRKREISYEDFIRGAYREIPEGGWDGVAIHPFPRFKARDGYLEDIEEHLDALRAALSKVGAAGTPIWVTEIGLSTSGPFPYTPEAQAEGLATIYTALDAMPDVAAISVHRLIDGPKKPKTAEAGWGVVKRNLTPKPALCALTEARGNPC